MKKRMLLISAIAAMAFLTLTSNSTGPGGTSNGIFTGGPRSNGNTCGMSGCHNPQGTGTTTGNIASIIDKQTGDPVTKYVASRIYTIQVTGTSLGNPQRRNFGFQLVALKNSDSAQAGNFVSPTDGRLSIRTVSGISVLEHNQRLFSATGGLILNVDWVAPTSAAGPVTFYGIINGVDSSLDNTGDRTSTPFSKTLADGTNVNDVEKAISINIFPNPTYDKMTLKMDNTTPGKYSIAAYDIRGKKLFAEEVTINNTSFETTVNTNRWAAGLYHIEISKDGERHVTAVMKH